MEIQYLPQVAIMREIQKKTRHNYLHLWNKEIRLKWKIYTVPYLSFEFLPGEISEEYQAEHQTFFYSWKIKHIHFYKHISRI